MLGFKRGDPRGSEDSSIDAELAHLSQTLAGQPISLLVPNTELLLQGEYLRVGPDLVITTDNGEQLVVADYFAYATPPDLATIDGVKLLAETVNQLIVPRIAPDPRSDVPVMAPVMVAGPLLPGMLATGAPSIGEVKHLRGDDAYARSGDGQWRKLAEGDAVFEGDNIHTGLGAISLEFVDGTHFNLGDHARAILNKYVYDPDAGQGSFFSTILVGAFRYISSELAHLALGRHTQLKTPTVTIGIRGSHVEGVVDLDGGTTVVHYDGILDVADVEGIGFVTLIETGTATRVYAEDDEIAEGADPAAESISSAAPEDPVAEEPVVEEPVVEDPATVEAAGADDTQGTGSEPGTSDPTSSGSSADEIGSALDPVDFTAGDITGDFSFSANTTPSSTTDSGTPTTTTITAAPVTTTAPATTTSTYQHQCLCGSQCQPHCRGQCIFHR